MKYARANKPAVFLEAIAPKLNEAQKLCILLNMVDRAMAGGEASPRNRRRLPSFSRPSAWATAPCGIISRRW